MKSLERTDGFAALIMVLANATICEAYTGSLFDWQCGDAVYL
jgi:hypothetical protein